MARYIALLRGINVGGKNRLAMPKLVQLFELAGAADVRTYIQSGNVVFGATAAVVKRLPAAVGMPMVVRTAAQWRALAHPFDAPREQLHVVFLAEPADPARLDPLRSLPDRFEVGGREIYLHCPNGIGQSKLTTAYFDRQLTTTSTIRNWNTVCALGELL
jgi:uncharacterized protein (DUF1697 family)